MKKLSCNNNILNIVTEKKKKKKQLLTGNRLSELSKIISTKAEITRGPVPS